MKMTKKFLIGAAALVAAMGLMSCGGDDDVNKMITGKNSHYEIDYTNESTEDTSRGYKDTAMKHAGGLVKVTINSTSGKGSNGGVMGVIFDLHENASDKNAKDFYVVAVRNDDNFYFSKFTNVTDINAENFGTELTDNPAVETQIVPKTGVFQSFTLNTDEDGNKFAYLYYKSNEDGSIECAILKENPAAKDSKLSDKDFEALEIADAEKVVLTSEDTGYTAQKQNKIAVYANVYKSGTLSGSWDFVGTYKEADVVEE